MVKMESWNYFYCILHAILVLEHFDSPMVTYLLKISKNFIVTSPNAQIHKLQMGLTCFRNGIFPCGFFFSFYFFMLNNFAKGSKFVKPLLQFLGFSGFLMGKAGPRSGLKNPKSKIGQWALLALVLTYLKCNNRIEKSFNAHKLL